MPPSSSQEYAVLLPLAVSLAAIVATIAIHAASGMAVIHLVRREYGLGRAGRRFLTDLSIINTVTLLSMAAHLADIVVWAIILRLCGEFASLASAFYHSAVNYTSLGYGDIVMSSRWSLLGPMEAANGLLLFGLSTALIFAVMERLVRARFGDISDGI